MPQVKLKSSAAVWCLIFQAKYIRRGDIRKYVIFPFLLAIPSLSGAAGSNNPTRYRRNVGLGGGASFSCPG